MVKGMVSSWFRVSNVQRTDSLQKQDYDDWNLPGWSGEDFFKYMAKVCNTGHIQQ